MKLLPLRGKERLEPGTAVDIASNRQDARASIDGELLNVIDSQRWMTREQFLGGLSEEDRTNVLGVEQFLLTLPSLKRRLKGASAGLFVIGSAALPRELSEKVQSISWRDIDLRLVFSGVPTEKIVDEIESSFSASPLAGLFRRYDFPRDVAYGDISTKHRMKFYPFGDSASVDLLLPDYGSNGRNIRDFLSVHAEKLRSIKDNLQKPLCIDWEEPKRHARHMLIEAFIVPLNIN